MLPFEDSLVRFGTSGTLILFYSLVDHAARRAAGDSTRARVNSPRWVGALVFASITAFYLSIKPMGGAVWSGYGNLVGISLCLLAMVLRWATRLGATRVRMPEVAARMAFYVALPLAVGVPVGWLLLSLPAILATAYVCVREDRMLVQQFGPSYAERIRSSARWIPGVF
ncbi:MAG: hypothetical protein ABIU54_00055 [Candidatus Eisenbacteria bacterium]